MMALRADARFRPAMDALARECVDFFTTLDANGLWMLSDVGRSSIYTAALVLDSSPAGLTMADLTAVTHFAAYSRGRVKDFVARALRIGEMTVPMGSELWTQRRITLSPVFVDRMHRRFMADIRAATILYPELAGSEDALRDDAAFRRFLFWLGAFATKERVGMKGWAPMHLFYHREGGGRVMNYLLAAQPPARERFLVSAEVSRSELAAACGVSRPHIKRMLDAAEEAGLLSFPARGVIRIEPVLSDDMERACAFTCQLMRAAATAAMQGGGSG